ncbi:diguanylate cyclase [Dactylosporangium sucinum]|uniref:GGDEF domain-containing protein n=1 Tax=Dactylosporangium sucinum TaxID=1424081 RepID=A0A917WTK6_9ACTN|nr:sensor domain-containing diguanylate cyclase [Dactylosporangium sucinum]GGM26884.1 GGDEF domain-containing protein [Dactylosporangium sucinum]
MGRSSGSERWARGGGSRPRTFARGADEPYEIRAARRATLPDTWLLAVAALLWSQAVGWFALLITGRVWALAWIVADGAIQAGRMWLTLRHRRAASGRGHPPHRGLVLANVIWFVVMAAGVVGALRAGDPRLLVLGCILPIGFMGYVASRYAAFPRLAAPLLYLMGAAQVVGFLAVPQLRAVAVLAPAAPIAFHLLVLQNHTILISAFVAQQENFRLSMHDPLTGLANRLLLRERTAALLDGLARDHRQDAFAVLCLDLDGFKPINDRHGHAVGDRLLKSVAVRLRQAVRGQDLVCRIGGDEFVVVLPGVTAAAAVHTAERLIEACGLPYHLDDAATVRVGVSVGIALAPEHGTSTDELLLHADAALYASKRRSKGSWTVHPAPIAGPDATGARRASGPVTDLGPTAGPDVAAGSAARARSC